MKKQLFLIALVLGLMGCQSTTNQEQQMNHFIDQLMQQMTLEEKMGQLNLPAIGEIVTGQMHESNIADDLRHGRVGGYFNLKGADRIREVQQFAVDSSRLHIPLIFGMDVIHGYETVFPIPLAMACTWNPELIERSSQVAAREATADGICWTYSPMVDICHDARWGRIAEGFGEDPYLCSLMGAAMVRGYQQTDLSDSATMMACVKHFALYGAPDGGRDYNTVDMSTYRMFNEYLPPYRAAVEAGAGSVMASFNTINGVPATCNRWLLTDLLRNEWGFSGMVVSDYTGIDELLRHGVGSSLQEVTEMSVKAGVDMDMVSRGVLTLPPSMEKYIDQACRRVLEAKWKLGLFEDPYRYCHVTNRDQKIWTAENRACALEVAHQSAVLLKNNQVLPLRREQTIGLVGPIADDRANMSGTWSVAAVPSRYTTLRAAMEQAVQGKGQIVYEQGCNLMDDMEQQRRATLFGRDLPRVDERDFQRTIQRMRHVDVIVVAMGEACEMTGESSCYVNIEMPDAQHRLLEALCQLGKPVVLLHLSGRPTVLNWETEHVDAIVESWFLGSEMGQALTDIVFGDVNPSGRLAVSLPRHVGQMPLSYRQMNTGRPTPSYQKFASCYADVDNSPLYPFGYGLSYSSVRYDAPTLSDTVLTKDGTILLSVQIHNTGAYSLDETVQLYIRDQVAMPTRPMKELRAFQRVHLAAGESQEVTFSITPSMLGCYDAQGQWQVEAGNYDLMVGAHSAALVTLPIQYLRY